VNGVTGETPAARVTALSTYPIKSCAAVPLTEARVTPRGLELDREFMLIDEDDDFVSQRKVPELALVVPVIGERSISLTATGMEAIEVPRAFEPDDRAVVTATVHARPVVGQLVGRELDEWFTELLPPYKGGKRFRLLRVRADVPGYIKERYRKPQASNEVGFADGTAMLLASEPSLARLAAELEQPIPMNRFRANVVVDGAALEPYDEDHWRELRIGALHAFVVKACDRCVVPDVDQATAVVGKDVRRALRARKGVNAYDESNKGVFFAQGLNHVYEPGVVVRLGDPVEVLARSARPNVRLGVGDRACV